MRLGRVLLPWLTLALLSGCSPGTGSNPEAPGSQPPTPPPPVSGEGGSGVLLSPVSGALERRTYASAQEIPAPGLYMVNLVTGQVESWARPGQPDHRVSLLSGGRWVISETPEQVHLADRKSGEVFGWSRKNLQLAGWSADRFLFVRAQEGAGPRTLYLTDDRFRLQRTLTLDLGSGGITQVQFSPDGQRLALATDRLYLVDLATGRAQDLNPPPAGSNGQPVATELLGPVADQLVVSQILQVTEPAGRVWERSLIRRFSWQGELLGEYLLDGRTAHPALSPDGRLLTWNQSLNHLATAGVVADLTTGEPQFRVAGASAQAWTADGSLLLLQSLGGSQYMVTRGGSLREAPPIPGGSQMVFNARITPSPDDPRRFAAGLSVVDETGRVVQSVQLPKRDDWLIWSTAWGNHANELLINIYPLVGKGNIGMELPLAPQVQRPPFPDPYLLVVSDPAGECLNLRESYYRSSRVIRCLPPGTRVAVGDLSQAPIRLNHPTWHEDDQLWLWARTEQNETGWLSLSAGSLGWAP